MTPLVCHPDSMLVYPTLSADLQAQWDKLEGEMVRGVLTMKVTNQITFAWTMFSF